MHEVFFGGGRRTPIYGPRIGISEKLFGLLLSSPHFFKSTDLYRSGIGTGFVAEDAPRANVLECSPLNRGPFTNAPAVFGATAR